jgi:flagellar motor switch protein FliN
MAEALTARMFVDGLVSEFTTTVESMLGAAVAVAPSAPGDGAGWLVRITVSGGLRGTIATWIAQADAAVLAQHVLGTAEPPDEATVIETLRDVWKQATTAMAIKDAFTSVTSAMSAPEIGVAEPDALASYELTMAGGSILRLSIADHVTAEGETARVDTPAPVPVPAPVRVTAPVALPVPVSAPAPVPAPARAPVRAAPPPQEPSSDVNSKLELVLDIDLPLVVRFGRTTMSLKELSDLGPGSIVDMGRSPDAPVEMLVGDRVIARGEVVVVAGNYGVRIVDLVSSAERIRALEE